MFWSRSVPSLESMLKAVLGRKRWRAVAQQKCDLRLLGNYAAQISGAIEEDLLAACAKHAKLRFVRHVEALDATMLPDGITLGDLHAAGAVPVLNHGFIAGVVCVDPSLLRRLPLSLLRSQIALSTWSIISAALEESEDHFRRTLQKAQPVREMDAGPARRIMSTMVGEASAYGAYTIEVSETQGVVYYRFVTADGRRAEGDVDLRAKAALLSELERLSQGGPVALPDQKTVQIFRASSGAYTLRIQQALPAPQEQCSVVEHALEPSAPSKVVEFPLQPALEQRATEDSQGRLVLIIDDNTTFARVLERFLDRHGLKTTYVASCEEALELLSHQALTPDLVISDVHMSGMNGFEFLKEFRKLFASAPIVMLTSDDDVETQLALLRDGADAYIRKTEDPRVLCTQAVRLLSRRQAA